MKKILIIGLLFLAACKPTEEEKQNLMNALPEGCVVNDIGSYGSIDNLIIITCDGRQVEATHTRMLQQNGRSSETDQASVFVIH